MKKALLLLIITSSLLLTGCGNQKVEVVNIDTGLNTTVENTSIPTRLEVSFILNKDFVKNYQYEDSKNYCFAANIIYSGERLGYYNVYRNKNNGVSNDKDLGLDGCIPANVAKEGYTITIPLYEDIFVSKPKGEYGFKVINLSKLDYNKFDIERSTTKYDTQVMDTYITIK